MEAKTAERVIIATDHPEILEAAKRFGGEARMTSEDHPSGTDRVAEVARDLPNEIVINLQGDEPEIDPADLDALAGLLDESPEAGVATLAHPVGEEEAVDPSVVKVVCDREGYALYFSRSPIPFHRNGRGAGCLRHVGIYAYRKASLIDLAATKPTPLEEAEGLEQLRALERGVRIRVGQARTGSVGIDTAEDYRKFVERYLGKKRT